MRRLSKQFIYPMILAMLSLSKWSLAEPVSDANPRSRPAPGEIRQLILKGAKDEAAKHPVCVDQYHIIAYPGGDVPKGTGVCTDLVIRAFRKAGFDLQALLHEDRVAHPEAYPTHIWEQKRADKNIDHRRCQNLAVWFKRHAQSLTKNTEPSSLSRWFPGDVVFYVRQGASYPWHVAIVSDKRDRDGMPLIIDSYPPWTSESHRLDEWAPIHSHFRFRGLKQATCDQEKRERGDSTG
jgi:uncharacterized protein